MTFDTSNEKLTLFVCVLSLFGEIGTFAAYLVAKEWTRTQEDAKRVFFVMAIFDFLDSMN